MARKKGTKVKTAVKKILDLEKEKLDAKEDEMEDTMEEAKLNEYTFGTGDIVNDKDLSCPHYGSKGIVIQIPSQGEIRYSVTNTGDTFKPGDILTKDANQLEKI